MIQLSPAELSLVTHFLYDSCGNDLHGKEYLINSKVSLLCFSLHFDSFAELWAKANEHSPEGSQLRQQLIDKLTTNYTYFYREERHFKSLHNLIAEGKLPCGHHTLRCWSAGCASGQEPYNLAMVLSDTTQEGLLRRPFEIIGSDISYSAITQARKGRFSTPDYVRLPLSWRKKYCFRTPGGCEVRKTIREHVRFFQENVLETDASESYDVVFCRNMIIYLNKRSVKRLTDILRNAIMPGGYLFLGHAEILNYIPGFIYLEPSLWRRSDSQANPTSASLHSPAPIHKLLDRSEHRPEEHKLTTAPHNRLATAGVAASASDNHATTTGEPSKTATDPSTGQAARSDILAIDDTLHVGGSELAHGT